MKLYYRYQNRPPKMINQLITLLIDPLRCNPFTLTGSFFDTPAFNLIFTKLGSNVIILCDTIYFLVNKINQTMGNCFDIIFNIEINAVICILLKCTCCRAKNSAYSLLRGSSMSPSKNILLYNCCLLLLSAGPSIYTIMTYI